jgi:hypothetical protein
MRLALRASSTDGFCPPAEAFFVPGDTDLEEMEKEW